MTAGQRRILWLVCFGMTYIFWYEASGRPLVWEANAPQSLSGAAAHSHYWEQIGYGCFFAAFGAILTLILRSKEHNAPLTWADTIGLALGIGTLIGTAIRSAMHIGVW